VIDARKLAFVPAFSDHRPCPALREGAVDKLILPESFDFGALGAPDRLVGLIDVGRHWRGGRRRFRR
jgi:hypothetical protein